MKIKIYLGLAMLLVVARVQAVTFTFGSSGKIVYDLKTGTFDAFNKNEQLLKGAYAAFKEQNTSYSSVNYTQRSYNKTNISTSFGKGIKHTITLRGAGMPVLKQVFYTYNELPYFLCELEISGKDLSSNQFIPIAGQVPFLSNSAQLRSVFIPFDNDTFISYESKPLLNNGKQVSAEAGLLFDNADLKGLVAGSVNHRIWKTGVLTSKDATGNILIKVEAGYTEKEITRDELPHGALKGSVIKSPVIFYGAFNDWRTGMETFAKANKTAEPPVIFKWNQATPLGWNSWGVMQDKISYDKIVKVTDFFADSLPNFRSGETLFVDLDSYWDNMLKGGLEGDYSTLKKFAGYVKSKGLKPGIYWAPFTDWGFKDGGNRRAEGGNYKFADLWTKVGQGYHDLDGARALDPTHPGTQQRIALVIGKLKECGFEMIKIDFLGHAAVESDHFYDKQIHTGMQAYEAGMSYLLKQLDGKMLVYAAISPTMASGRYVHMRRIACDAFKTIKDTRYTLNGVTYGWWQSHLYDFVDADHVVLADETMGANRARTLSAVVTGTFISGDDFSTEGPWTSRAKELFQNKALLDVIRDGKSFRPLDGDKEAAEVFIKQTDDAYYVALFNYGETPESFKLTADKVGIKSFKDRSLQALFAGKQLQAADALATIEVAAGDAELIKIKR